MGTLSTDFWKSVRIWLDRYIRDGNLACDRPTGVRGPDTHDRTITTETPDEMWAIDATGCLTDEGNAAVFVVIDHCRGAGLGVRAARRATCASKSAKSRVVADVSSQALIRIDGALPCSFFRLSPSR